MNKKRTSILTDLERNYKDTKSISKSVDLSALENGVNPHKIYNKLIKDADNTPKDAPKEKISVGDIVSINQNDDNNQYEIINISNKDFIVLKNINTDEVIQKSYDEIKPVMESLDMAKKKINETQYTVSISDLNTTDANALSQMMSAAAQADSSNVDAGVLDMTTTPELPTPETMEEPTLTPSFDEPVMGDEMGTSLPSMEMPLDEPSFEDSELEGEDTEVATENELDVEGPSDDMSEFDLENEDINIDDDIDFDEEIGTEDDFESEIAPEEGTSMEEAYNGSYETIKQEYLAGDASEEEAISALIDMGEAADDEEALEIISGWDSSDIDDEYSMEDDMLSEEEVTEDILLPSDTKDETKNAMRKYKKEEKDEESEKIAESMDALIKSILENAKTEQEVYAEEITEDTDNEDDEEITLEDAKDNLAYWQHRLRIVDMGDDYAYSNGRHNSVERQVDYWRKKVEELSMNNKEITEEDEEILDEDDDFDSDIAECLKSAGIQLEEATVKPTIVTDESTFANKPNKALKPEDDKEPKVKKVSTSEFGAEASEPAHCLPSLKCEAVAPKDKIKKIYETAKVRYSKADKADWNKLDRRYITKLIENGCGYQRASRIILEAKKG